MLVVVQYARAVRTPPSTSELTVLLLVFPFSARSSLGVRSFDEARSWCNDPGAMQRCRGVRIFAVAAVTSVIAAASAWTMPAPAAQDRSTLKTVAGTVSCATSQGALQLDVFAYRPAWGYGAASVDTGPANTGAANTLVGVQSDKPDYTLDKGCSRTKKSVRFTHRGLSLSEVAAAGYNQEPTVYFGVPRRVFVRYRIDLASSGKPGTATVTVWAKRNTSSRLHEIGYSQWSRSKSTTYYSRRACTSQQY